MLGRIPRASLLNLKLIVLRLSLCSIPPLKKGGMGGFSDVHKNQIPLTPPFSKGDVGLVVAALSLLLSFNTAIAQIKKPASLAELAAFTGADREKRLIAVAKAEC